MVDGAPAVGAPRRRRLEQTADTWLPAVARPALALLALLLAADAAVVALHVANELSGANAVLFNLDEEQNLPTWLSSVQFAAVAACAALAGICARGRPRAAWWTLSAIFLFFSADEAALVHEKLASHLESTLEGIPKLLVIYSPIMAVCAAAAYVLAGEVRRDLGSALPFLFGFVLLAASIVLDAADIQAFDLTRFRPLIVLEEAFELGGTALLATVALAWFLARAASRAGAASRRASAP